MVVFSIGLYMSVTAFNVYASQRADKEPPFLKLLATVEYMPALM